MSTNHPMQMLVNSLFDFQEKNPNLTDIDTVSETTGNFSSDICDKFISEYPELEGRKLYLHGQRSHFPNRHNSLEEFENPDSGISNVVCLIKDNYVVDLTYKLWDKTASSFMVNTYDGIQKEWMVITEDVEVMENFTSITSYIRQGTKKWQELAYPSLLETELEKPIAKNTASALRCYNQVFKDLNEGLIIFTGTEENNIHLWKLKNEYKEKFSSMENFENMNDLSKKQTEILPFSLVGKYFHVFGEEGKVDLQGVVVGMVTDQYAFVQYFDLVSGQKSTMEIIPIVVMAVGGTFNKSAPFGFQFYETLEAMNHWYKYHRPGVGI